MSWEFDINNILGGNPEKLGGGTHVDLDPATKIRENIKANHMNYVELAIKEIQTNLDEGVIYPDSMTFIEEDPQYGSFESILIKWTEHADNVTDQYGVHILNPIANGNGDMYAIYIENAFKYGIYSNSNSYFSDIITPSITSLEDFYDEVVNFQDNNSFFSIHAARANTCPSIYLYTDNVPTNISPFILPYNANLIFMSASASKVDTWKAEIHKEETLVPNALLSLNLTNYNYGSYNIEFAAGDKIELYCNASGADNQNVENPTITAIFKRRL